MKDPNDRSQFRKVETGNGYDRNLAATTNDRLEMTVIELQNLRESNTDQTKKLGTLLGNLDESVMGLQSHVVLLTNTIKEANKKNDRQQKWFLFISIIGTLFAASGII